MLAYCNNPYTIKVPQFNKIIKFLCFNIFTFSYIFSSELVKKMPQKPLLKSVTHKIIHVQSALELPFQTLRSLRFEKMPTATPNNTQNRNLKGIMCISWLLMNWYFGTFLKALSLAKYRLLGHENEISLNLCNCVGDLTRTLCVCNK